MKYILIAFSFVACTSKKPAPQISIEKLDTIKTVPQITAAAPALFENAFTKGSTAKIKNTTVSLYGINIGTLKITSGRIVLCDPLHIDEYGIPFQELFPTGEFPVQLSIANAGDGELTAFARIIFSDAPVIKWQPAMIVSGEETVDHYSVDWGRAVLMDQQTIRSLDVAALTESDHPLYKEMDKHYHNNWKYTMYNAGNNNLAAFTTGDGDGSFKTYVGSDAQGKICRLVTDFGLFEWKKK